jgi:Protein of unknown function (DUF2849)
LVGPRLGAMAESKDLVVVTARFLGDGAPSYLKADGTWSRFLKDAKVFEEDAGEAEAAARNQREQPIIADAYTFNVALKDGAIDPLSTRERIRAEGPTTRLRRPD